MPYPYFVKVGILFPIDSWLKKSILIVVIKRKYYSGEAMRKGAVTTIRKIR